MLFLFFPRINEGVTVLPLASMLGFVAIGCGVQMLHDACPSLGINSDMGFFGQMAGMAAGDALRVVLEMQKHGANTPSPF